MTNCTVIVKATKSVVQDHLAQPLSKLKFYLLGTINSLLIPSCMCEAVNRVLQKTFYCIYLLLQKRRFFIAALICQLIIFSYKIHPWLPVIHSASYHVS